MSRACGRVGNCLPVQAAFPSTKHHDLWTRYPAATKPRPNRSTKSYNPGAVCYRPQPVDTAVLLGTEDPRPKSRGEKGPWLVLLICRAYSAANPIGDRKSVV